MAFALVYVLGGWNSDFCVARKTVERYDVASNTWTSAADMLFGRGDMAAGSIDAFMFSIAGETKDAACVLSVLTAGTIAYGMLQDEPTRFEQGLRGQIVAVNAGNPSTVTIALEDFGALLNLDVSGQAKV